MALIKDSYDLTGGNTNSSEVTSITNWRIQTILSGCNAQQRTRVSLWTKGENGDFEPVLDEKGCRIAEVYTANDGGTINVIGINAPTGRVLIEPLVDTDVTIAGTVSIDSYQV